VVSLENCLEDIYSFQTTTNPNLSLTHLRDRKDSRDASSLSSHLARPPPTIVADADAAERDLIIPLLLRLNLYHIIT